MNTFWYWSQAAGAGLLALYELVAIAWLLDPNAFEFPLANVLGLFAVIGFLPGVIFSLAFNQRMLVRRGNPVVSQRERVLLSTEFVVIAASLVMLAIQGLFLENLIVWFVVIVLAIVNLSVLARRQN